MRKLLIFLFSMATISGLLTGCSDARQYESKHIRKDLAQIKNIIVEVKDRKVDVVMSNDEKILFDYYESDQDGYDIHIKDVHTLLITLKKDRALNDYIGVKPALEQQTIKVSIPNKALFSLSF